MGIAGWNPAWYRTGESLISLALKVAYGNSTTVGAVVERIVAASASHRLPSMFPEAAAAERACRMLALPARIAETLFVGIGKPSLEVREGVCIALRWCPSCLLERFHAWDFQKWKNGFCRFHGDRLLDRCPWCFHHVDPLMLRGWNCPVCALSFAADLSSDWQRVFQRPASAELASAAMSKCGPAIELNHNRSGLAVSHISTGQHDSEPRQWNPVSEYAAIRRQAWEQCSAIVDCLYGEHQTCVENEWAASHLEYDVTRFECPLGAAVAQTLAWLGCKHERCGGWPDSTFGGSDALPEMWSMVGRAPSWLSETLVREATKEWLSDAMQKFSAGEGRSPRGITWRPPKPLGLRWHCAESRASIKIGPVARKLLHNALEGAKACRTLGITSLKRKSLT